MEISLDIGHDFSNESIVGLDWVLDAAFNESMRVDKRFLNKGLVTENRRCRNAGEQGKDQDKKRCNGELHWINKGKGIE
jgi:hypothetical protein